MGLFTRQFEKEGAGLPMPEGGLARYFAILFSNFWKLTGANLLFILFSLPLITLPAALCALNRVCIMLYRNGHCYLWQDFRDEFKGSFKRSLLPALFFMFLLFFAYYAMSLGLTNTALPLWSMLFWTLGIISAAGALCWGSYYFVLAAMLNQDNRGLLKNARLLCMIKPHKALAVAVIIVAVIAALAAIMPISLLLVAFFVPALLQYTLSFVVYELAEEFILE